MPCLYSRRPRSRSAGSPVESASKRILVGVTVAWVLDTLRRTAGGWIAVGVGSLEETVKRVSKQATM